MKLSPWLIPALVFAIAGGWLGWQSHALTTVEAASDSLRERIAAARASEPEADGLPLRAASTAKHTKTREPFDWKSLAALCASMRNDGDGGDLRAMVHFQQRLLEMSAEDLAAAEDEFAALDLAGDARADLERTLVEELIKKDCELALRHFAGRLRDADRTLHWRLAKGLGDWAKKSPVAAAAWFDQQAAAGQLDGKALDGSDQFRSHYEGALIGALQVADPDAAVRRLSALPDEQRAEALRFAK